MSPTQKQHELIIVGGGIAGLAAAFYAKKAGVDFLLLEASSSLGGCIQSKQLASGFVVEKGPSSCALGENLQHILKELNLEFLDAKAQAKHKLIYFNSKLHAVTKPADLILKGEFFSFLDYWFLCFGRNSSGKAPNAMTIHEFFTEYFSESIANKLAWPLLNGIYAGDPRRLSLEAAFPALVDFVGQEKSFAWALCQNLFIRRFSKTKNSSKRRIISFNHGLQELVQAITGFILDRNVSLNCEVTQISKTEQAFSLKTLQGEFSAHKVLVASPSASAYKLLSALGESASHEYLNQIPYSPVVSLTITLPKRLLTANVQAVVEESFGFLRAKDQDLNSLGMVFASSVFENRAPKDSTSLTCFVGGMLNATAVELPEQELLNLVLQDLKRIFDLNLNLAGFEELKAQNKAFCEVTRWSQGIPQYYLGHKQAIASLNKELPHNLALAGNYLNGVSVEDTIKSGKLAFDKLFAL